MQYIPTIFQLLILIGQGYRNLVVFQNTDILASIGFYTFPIDPFELEQTDLTTASVKSMTIRQGVKLGAMVMIGEC